MWTESGLDQSNCVGIITRYTSPWTYSHLDIPPPLYLPLTLHRLDPLIDYVEFADSWCGLCSHSRRSTRHCVLAMSTQRTARYCRFVCDFVLASYSNFCICSAIHSMSCHRGIAVVNMACSLILRVAGGVATRGHVVHWKTFTFRVHFHWFVR